MPLKDKKKRQEYINAWKRASRRKRGLKRRGGLRPRVSKEHTLNRLRKWRLKYLDINPQKRLLWAARKRSKEKGIICSITEKDILIPKLCPYLGIELVTHVPRGNKRDQCMSLDRKDNTKGYTPDNIEVISHLANTMKNNASNYLLVCFANEILKRYGDPAYN